MPLPKTTSLGIPFLTVFQLNVIMVIELTPILHQPTWYTIFGNDKWGGFNTFEHNSERKSSVGTGNAVKIFE